MALSEFFWKNLRLIVVFASLSLGIFALHWWKNVRPFFNIEHGTLCVMSTEVRSDEAGQLAQCSLEEGDFFQVGQSLFSLDASAFIAELKEIDRKAPLYRKEIEEMKLKVDQTMQQYLYLQKELSFEGKTSELLDEMLKEAQKMQGNCFQIEKELIALQNERSELEKKIAKRSLLADFEGVVLKRFKEVGDKVDSKEPIFLITNNKKRWVEAEVPEEMLMKVQVGLPAFLEFVSYPKKKWAAQISWISPVAKEGKLKIRLTADNLPCYSGLHAKASIRTRRATAI